MPLLVIGRRARVSLALLAALGCGWLVAHRFSSKPVPVAPPTPAQLEPPPPATPPPEELVLTVGLEREKFLEPGGSHRYTLHLAAGTYVELILEQHGIDVVGRLLTPSGERWLNVDSPSGTQGEELVLFVAPSSGRYELTVASEEIVTKGGTYKLHVGTHRLARGRDRERAGAEKLFDDAENARRAGTAHDPARAERLDHEAATRFRELSEPVREALVLRSLGRLYLQQGQYAVAHSYLTQAQRVFEDLENQGLEAQTLQYLAETEGALGHLERAARHYERGIEISGTTWQPSLQATLWTDYATLLQQQGQVDRAMDALSGALETFTRSGNLLAAALVRSIEAEIRWGLADYDNAIASLEKALDTYRLLGMQADELETLVTLGDSYFAKGDHERCWQYYAQAQELLAQVESKRALTESESSTAAVLWNSLGLFYQEQGQTEPALQLHLRALALYRSFGDYRSEAILRRNIGVLFLRSEDFEAAEPYFQEAFDLSMRVENRRTAADSLYGLARVEAQRGELMKAWGRAEAVLTMLEDSRAVTASPQLRASAFATRQQVFDFFIDLAMRLHPIHPSGDFAARAFEICERARARSLLDRIQLRSSRSVVHDDEHLRDNTERLRAELEVSLSASQHSAHSSDESRTALAQRAVLRSLLAGHERAEASQLNETLESRGAGSAKPLSAKEVQHEVRGRDSVLLEYCLGEPRSYLWAVTKSEIAGFTLPPRNAIEDLARSLYEQVSIGRDAVVVARSKELARELAELLLRPVAEFMPGKRILVVADGDLALVPFAALPAPSSGRAPSQTPEAGLADEPLLGVVSELVYLPSASAAFYLRERQLNRKQASRLLALVGDPVFGVEDSRLRTMQTRSREAANTQRPARTGTASAEDRTDSASWPRLQRAGREIQDIVRSASGHSVLRVEGLAANRSFAVGPALSRYRILHFATHAFVDSELPDLSGLVLSQVDALGRPINGVLRAYEIRSLDLRADLVVLSACDTARGKKVRGEGIESLGRSFLAAGAAQTLVNLWKVEDDVAEAFMRRFYQAMLGEGHSPSEALLLAQRSIAVRPEWEAPYFWAGFSLLGEAPPRESWRQP